MKKKFINLLGEEFEVTFEPHDISGYNHLYHVTRKRSRKSIEEYGLLVYQSQYKSLVQTGMLFLSYPIDQDTSDCFRWSDEHHSLIILDAKKLESNGFKFYNDYFSSKDASSKRNHICIDRDIPKEYIKNIIEF